MANEFVKASMSGGGGASSGYVAYTPSGAWTSNCTFSGMSKLVDNEELFVYARISITGAVSGTCTLSLPSGYTINATKLLASDQNYSLIEGNAVGKNSTTGYRLHINYFNSTHVCFTYTSSGGTAWLVAHNAPVTWTNGAYIHVAFRVPVTAV